VEGLGLRPLRASAPRAYIGPVASIRPLGYGLPKQREVPSYGADLRRLAIGGLEGDIGLKEWLMRHTITVLELDRVTHMMLTRRYIPGVGLLPTRKSQPPCDASGPSQRKPEPLAKPQPSHHCTPRIESATPASIPCPHKLTRRQPPPIHERSLRVPTMSTCIKLLTGHAFSGE
jgi:hypothetical protein